ncbi:MAG: hypothetical protein NTW19_20985 [Planctomycetota bacterium]|nr:hypothetical protein [Planctomycetota bacterium]
MLERYRPSGRFDPVFIGAAFAAVIPALVAAWIYQKLIWWIPLIYICWLITFGMAFGLYMLTGFAVRMGKCRNTAIAVVAGALLGFAALVAAHAVNYLDCRAMFAREAMSEATQKGWKTLADAGMAEGGNGTEGANGAETADLAKVPLSADLFAHLYTFDAHRATRAASGWTIGRHGSGIPITGLFVYLIWLIEAGLLVGGAAMGGMEGARAPFDETGNAWMEQTEVHKVASTTAELAKQIADADEVDRVTTPAPTIKNNVVGLSYKLARPKDPAEPAFLSIEQETRSMDKHGKEQTSSKTIHSWVLLTPAQTALFLKRIAAASAPAPPPANV